MPQCAFLAAATSDNTRQAYRSAIKHYLDWGGVLPADEPAVIRYLVRYADALNPRTLAEEDGQGAADRGSGTDRGDTGQPGYAKGGAR
ncbi:hypothetical protein [Massilia sp. TWR1-2-2]|uniref:hypothetical protein n=1 Tax=Massilia sp. TWR1-2-2 TaxID=2804584 RepID=UPI003CF28903